MSDLLQDIRYALRQMRKSPGFTVTAVVVLALGLGATTGMLAIVHSVLLRSLNYRDADRMMLVGVSDAADDTSNVHYGDFKDMQRNLHQSEELGAYSSMPLAVQTSDGAQMLVAPAVTTNFFDLLGVHPALGRSFGRGDDAPNAAVAIVSHDFWQHSMHARPDILGSQLKVNQELLTVVGVMPHKFQFPMQNGNSLDSSAAHSLRTRRPMKQIVQDLRYGWRMLLKTPGLTAVVIVMLALGVGATSAVFSIFSATLLRPLPYDKPNELVHLNGLRNQGSFQQQPFSYPNFADIREHNQVFSQMGAYSGNAASLSDKDGAQQVITPVASAGFFETLGVKPALGRTFQLEDEQGKAAPVVMLTYGGWQRYFGGSPDVVGKTMVLDGTMNTVVGVLPRDFQFGPSQSGDIWQSVRVDGWKIRRNAFWMNPVARLKPGTTLQQAQAGISALARQLEQQYPDDNAGVGVQLVSLEDQLVGTVRPVLQLLMGTVAFVLLITCANVAGLLVARSAQRQKEISIRVALGARSGRILQQMLTESILLALLGGIAGTLTAVWLVPAIVNLLPQVALSSMPALQGLHVNPGVLVFSLAVSLLTGVLFGLIPALQVLKPDLRQELQEAGRSSVGAVHNRLRKVLVVSEVALAVILLVGAGLMLRSLQQVLHQDPGFDTTNLLTLGVSLPEKAYSSSPRQLELQRRLLKDIHGLPGIKDVAAVSIVPLSGSGNTSRFDLEGHPKASGGEEYEASTPTVTTNYFEMMKIPLRAGRFFSSQDTAKSTPVVMVNQALVDQVFHGQNPVGKRINFTYTSAPNLHEIIGVVGNENVDRLDARMQPIIYDTFEQSPNTFFSLAVRTAQPPETLANTVVKTVRDADPQVAVSNVASMAKIIHDSPTMLLRAYPAYLLAGFAATALILAVLGIYGLLAYSVVQRQRELGLRLALGAAPSDLRRLVVANGMKLTLIGATLGVAGGLATARLISSLLFGIKSTDAVTFTGVCLVLVLATLPATYIPALRATRVDPMETLRCE